jgi:hypothetical protein
VQLTKPTGAVADELHKEPYLAVSNIVYADGATQKDIGRINAQLGKLTRSALGQMSLDGTEAQEHG